MAPPRMYLVWTAVAVLLTIPPSVPAHAADATAPRPESTRKLSPLMTEIRALFDDEHATLLSLNRRLAGTSDQASALEIQRAIARVKLSTEVALLRVQAKYARTAGHAAFADELEAAARELESPPSGPAPAARSKPESTTDDDTDR